MNDPDPLEQARRAYQDARTAVAQYRLPEARRSIESARRLLASAAVDEDARFELALRIQLTESWVTCDDHGLVPALEQVHAAGLSAERARRRDLLALVHIQSGVLRARAGFVEDALAELRPAVELSEALPVDDRVRLLINKGTMGSEAGHLDEAAADLAAAAELAVGLPEYAFMALHNHGFVEYLRGDLPAALRSMHAADDMEVGVDRSVSRLDRSRVLMEAGLVDEAAALLAETVEAMRVSGMAEELTGALLDQARCALLRGRAADAVAMAEEVAARAQSRGETLRGLVASGVRLEALVAAGGGGCEDLVEEANRLGAEATAAGVHWLADRARALRVLCPSMGHPLRSDDGTAAALGRLRESPFLATRLLAIRAELILTPDEDRRFELVAAAQADITAAKAGMASLDLRTALTIHAEPIIALDLERAVAGGSADMALETTERWRAALETVPSVTPSPDAETARLFSELRQRHEDLRSAADKDSEAAAESEVARLERQLRERSWRGHSTSRVGAGGFGDADLGQPSVMLNYFWASGSLHLVHIPAAAPARLLRLGRQQQVTELVSRASADAAVLAHAPHGPLAAAVRSSLEDTLSQLDAAILPADLEDSPVVIVPSGPLARLPWGMLPRLRRRSVTLSRSSATWREGATRIRRRVSVGIATGPDLMLADSEAERVARNWAAATRVDGSPAAVREALAANDIVHIAAHGQHRSDNPLFSSLRLHGGSLFAHELEGTDVRASLVVLSACGAGRARLRPGDEPLGLTSSLLALGVRAVVAPLTDVPDDVACETMAGLHAGLAAGRDGPAALASASQGVLARSFTWFGSPWVHQMGDTRSNRRESA